MVFNKPGKVIKGKFTLGEHEVEAVDKYTYLGTTFSLNGSFATAISLLC